MVSEAVFKILSLLFVYHYHESLSFKFHDNQCTNVRARVVQGIPKLKQIVTKLTYKSKILDVLMTNLHSAYSIPVIAPPVLPDDPDRGVASDHRIVIAIPHTLHTVQKDRDYVTRTFRPLPDSGVREFGQWICSEGWGDIILDTDTPSEQVQKLENIFNSKLERFLPQKTVRINQNIDKPYITLELKKLDRKLKREYRKHRQSDKYLSLKKLYDEKLKKAAQAHLDKNVRSLKEDAPGKAYQTLKKMAAQPGDGLEDNTFQLSNHIEDNLTPQQSIESKAQHFAQISQEYPPQKE